MPTPADIKFKSVVHWRGALLDARDYAAFSALYGDHLSLLLTTSMEDGVVPPPGDERLWMLSTAKRNCEFAMSDLTEQSNIRALGFFLESRKAPAPREAPMTAQRARTLNQTLRPWERKFLREYVGVVRRQGERASFEDALLWVSKHCDAPSNVTPKDFQALAERIQQIKVGAPSPSRFYGAFEVLKPGDDKEEKNGDFILSITSAPTLS